MIPQPSDKIEAKNAIHRFDVIVLGAGPVGCAAALALHARGLRVALLERGAWTAWRGPHLTGVAESVEPTLARLGLGGIAPKTAVNHGHSLRVSVPGAPPAHLAWRPGGARWLVERRAFDQAVRARVDASGLPRWADLSGISVEEGADGITVRAAASAPAEAWSAGHLLLCEGAAATLARAMGFAHRAGPRRLYLGARTPARLLGPDAYAFLNDPGTERRLLVFDLGAAGTWLELEVDGRLSAQDAAPTHAVAELLRAHGLATQAPPIEGAWAATTLAIGARRPRARGRVLLLGDAASTLDPIASSGMLNGLLGVLDLAELARPANVPGPVWRRRDLTRWVWRSEVREARLRSTAAAFRALLSSPVAFHLGATPGAGSVGLRALGAAFNRAPR